MHSRLHSCTSPDCPVCEAYRLKQRVDQLAKCVRIQRQALLNIHETAKDADIVRLASEALQEARW